MPSRGARTSSGGVQGRQQGSIDCAEMSIVSTLKGGKDTEAAQRSEAGDRAVRGQHPSIRCTMACEIVQGIKTSETSANTAECAYSKYGNGQYGNGSIQWLVQPRNASPVTASQTQAN